MEKYFPRFAFMILLFLSMVSNSYPKNFKLHSPNKKIEIQVKTNDNLSFSVIHNGRQVLRPSPISMTIENRNILGKILKSPIVNQKT